MLIHYCNPFVLARQLYNEMVSEDWKEGFIMQGDLTDCNYWPGTTLLSAVGKVFSTALLRKVQECHQWQTLTSRQGLVIRYGPYGLQC